MSDTEPTEPTAEIGYPAASEDDFERVLGEATRLYRRAEFEGALKLLYCLEDRFGRHLRFMPLLGDVLMTMGEERRGLRYKVLHDVLTSALNVGWDKMLEPSVGDAVPPVPQNEGEEPGPEAPSKAAWRAASKELAEEAKDDAVPYTPPTISMGRLFMRQGHYDRALNTFQALLKASPEDSFLKELRDRAQKKDREKRLLGVLQKWAQTIDEMKSDPSGEP
jgi:hypothetical protein